MIESRPGVACGLADHLDSRQSGGWLIRTGNCLSRQGQIDRSLPKFGRFECLEKFHGYASGVQCVNGVANCGFNLKFVRGGSSWADGSNGFRECN